MSISGIIDSFNQRLIPNRSNKLFSYYSNSGSGTYTTNSNCWASGVNLSCHSVYNSTFGNQYNVTAISRNVVAMANHIALSSGAIVRFADGKGFVHQNEIVATSNLVDDLTLGKLKYTLPNEIVHAQIYTGEVYPSFTTPYIPVLVINQIHHATVLNLKSMDIYNNVYISAPFLFEQDKIKYYEPIINGDSGSPVFIIDESGKPLLLTCLYQTIGGPSYLHFKNQINRYIIENKPLLYNNRIYLDEETHIFTQEMPDGVQ